MKIHGGLIPDVRGERIMSKEALTTLGGALERPYVPVNVWLKSSSSL